MYECACAIAHRYTPTRRPEEAVKRPLLLLSTFSFEARSLSLSGVHIFPARLKSSEPQISFCFDFPQNCGYVCVWTPVLLRIGVCSELELHLFVDPWLLVPWMLESELFTLQQLHLTAMPSLQPLWLTLISAFFFHSVNHNSQFFDKTTPPWNSPVNCREGVCWAVQRQSRDPYKEGNDPGLTLFLKSLNSTRQFQKLCHFLFWVEVPRVPDFPDFLHRTCFT